MLVDTHHSLTHIEQKTVSADWVCLFWARLPHTYFVVLWDLSHYSTEPGLLSKQWCQALCDIRVTWRACLNAGTWTFIFLTQKYGEARSFAFLTSSWVTLMLLIQRTGFRIGRIQSILYILLQQASRQPYTHDGKPPQGLGKDSMPNCSWPSSGVFYFQCRCLAFLSIQL